jgi:hypothetical protein
MYCLNYLLKKDKEYANNSTKDSNIEHYQSCHFISAAVRATEHLMSNDPEAKASRTTSNNSVMCSRKPPYEGRTHIIQQVTNTRGSSATYMPHI